MVLLWTLNFVPVNQINMKNWKLLLALTLGLSWSTIYSQQNETKMNNTETVEKFLNGFNNPEEIMASLALLADDYKFKNPMVELHTKAAFIALAQEMGKVLTGVNLIHISQEGDWVATYYEFTSSIPGLESNYGSEWFRVEHGLIRESHLIYDASEWQKVYAQMSN